MRTLIALDLETTGFIKEGIYPDIVEIGAVKNTGEQFSTFLKPDIPIEPGASKATGIYMKDVKDSPSFRQSFTDFAEFMKGGDCLMTFNGTNFDIPILMNSLYKHKVPHRFPWCPYHFDLMKISKDTVNAQGKAGKKNPKLIELYKYLFDEEFGSQHRAVADAAATLRCGIELIDREIIRIA